MTYIKIDFNDFCSRSDADTTELYRVLSALPQDNAWIAGGAIRRVLLRQALDSDFDFFFDSQESLDRWELSLPNTLQLVRETKHHKHWHGALDGSEVPVDIQAIRFKFYESPEAVIDSFDYTITQFILDDGVLTTTPEALWDLGRRKLAIHRVTYPVATMRRMLKYANQGFTACGGCMAQLLRDTAASPEAMAELDIQYVD